jgi:hypothetical protein
MNEYKVDVPEGRSGDWEVRKFFVGKADSELDALQSMFSNGGGRGRFVPPGRYTGLYRGRTVIMSDTPDEIRDHYRFIRNATGHALIAGLGLGVVLQAVARKPEVSNVLVIEQSPDVVKLVEPHWKRKPWGKKFDIVLSDIFTWKPDKGARFDAAWFDVWDNLCTDNLTEMAKLHRRFARCAAFYGSWGHGLLKYQRDRERRAGW